MSTVSNQVWAEGRLFAPTENDKLLEALVRFHAEGEKDPNASLIFNSVPEGTLLVFIYAEHVEERPAVFNTFEGINYVAEMVPGNKYTISQIVSGFEAATATEPKKYSTFPKTPISRVLN